MKIRALKAFTIRDSETGDLTSIANGAIAEVSDTLGSSLISDGLAEEYTTNVPTGTIEITNNGTVNVANYASAEVNVPGIIPTGTVSITENGTVDVTDYASASVNVPGPTGTISITENGTVDVTNYASAVVNVPESSRSGTLRTTTNGLVKVGNYEYVDVDVPDFKNLVNRSITSVTDDMLQGVTIISYYAFYGCSYLKSVSLPSSVVSIYEYAFCGCSNLEIIIIPSSVMAINRHAFEDCDHLESITIPSDIQTIGEQAFYDCDNLTSVTVEATTPPSLGASAFGNTPSNLVIYVPSESVNAYKVASGWSDYKNQIQAIPG